MFALVLLSFGADSSEVVPDLPCFVCIFSLLTHHLIDFCFKGGHGVTLHFLANYGILLPLS